MDCLDLHLRDCVPRSRARDALGSIGRAGLWRGQTAADPIRQVFRVQDSLPYDGDTEHDACIASMTEIRTDTESEDTIDDNKQESASSTTRFSSISLLRRPEAGLTIS